MNTTQFQILPTEKCWDSWLLVQWHNLPFRLEQQDLLKKKRYQVSLNTKFHSPFLSQAKTDKKKTTGYPLVYIVTHKQGQKQITEIILYIVLTIYLFIG